MIEIRNKQACCGCTACMQVCPKQCISSKIDSQGFNYPIVNRKSCVNCGLCEKVCPILNPFARQTALAVYAGSNSNEYVRLSSSSGGIFMLLANTVIRNNGVVFGARFDDDWLVKHDCSESEEGLKVFCGSKYVQSEIGRTYEQAQDFLRKGRYVLYSGTGCQIAGLKRFLRKEYDNLLSVEIVCHSVPSPLVWRKYLRELSGHSKVLNVNFRNKETGWSKYRYSLEVETDSGRVSELSGGLYMKGLTKNLTTRPSCSNCLFKSGKSGSDLILGDCWGIWDLMPEIDDDKGISVIEIMTEKGFLAIQETGLQCFPISLTKIAEYNNGLNDSISEHANHDSFFKVINLGFPVHETIEQYVAHDRRSVLRRIPAIIKGAIKHHIK